MTTRITFNGREYDSPEAMPPEVRAAYDRAVEMLKDGGAGSGPNPRINIKMSTNVRFVHDGKTYNSLEEMPPEVRAKYATAMHQVDKDDNGVPDFLEGTSSSKTGPHPASKQPSPFEPPPGLVPPSLQPPVIQPDRSSVRLIAIAGLIILLLLLVVFGLVLYIFLH